MSASDAETDPDVGEAETARARHDPRGGPRITAPELFRRSRERLEAGALDEAVILALRSLEVRSSSPAHFEHAARTLYAHQLYRMSELVARRALDLGLTKPAIYVQLARALNRQGDLAGALHNFDRAIALAPDHAGFRQFRDKVAARLNAAGPAT